MRWLQVLQHAWTYKPMVQDVLGMRLNRVTLEDRPSASQQLLPQQPLASTAKVFEVSSSLLLVLH